MIAWQPALVVFILICILPVPLGAAVVFDTDWESGGCGTEGWDTEICDNHLVQSTDYSLTGTHSLKGIFTDVNGSAQQPATGHSLPNMTHLFARFGYTKASGFQIGSNGYTKIIRFRGDQGWPIFWIENHGGVYDVTVEAPYYLNDADVLDCNVSPAHAPTFDQIEFEVHLNTPGASNGAIRMWVNGTQCVNKANIALVGPTTTSRAGGVGNVTPSNLTYNDVQIFIQSGVGQVYFDRVAVGDTRIGPVGASTARADTTPPSTPVGISIR